MKIEKTQQTTFGMLNIGDVFQYSDGIYYMKTDFSDKYIINRRDPIRCNAVALEEGTLSTFKNDEYVVPIEHAKLVI